MVHEARKSDRSETRLAYGNELKKMGEIFGLFSKNPGQIPSVKTDGVQKHAEQAIHERSEAKKNKNFLKADEIRQSLLKQGIALMDHSDGTTTWRQV